MVSQSPSCCTARCSILSEKHIWHLVRKQGAAQYIRYYISVVNVRILSQMSQPASSPFEGLADRLHRNYSTGFANMQPGYRAGLQSRLPGGVWGALPAQRILPGSCGGAALAVPTLLVTLAGLSFVERFQSFTGDFCPSGAKITCKEDKIPCCRRLKRPERES